MRAEVDSWESQQGSRLPARVQGRGPPKELIQIDMFSCSLFFVPSLQSGKSFVFSSCKQLAYKAKELQVKVHVVVFSFILNGLHFVTVYLLQTCLFKFPKVLCHDLNIYHKEGHGAEAAFPQLSCSNFSTAVISNAACQMHI